MERADKRYMAARGTPNRKENGRRTGKANLQIRLFSGVTQCAVYAFSGLPVKLTENGMSEK